MQTNLSMDFSELCLLSSSSFPDIMTMELGNFYHISVLQPKICKFMVQELAQFTSLITSSYKKPQSDGYSHRFCYCTSEFGTIRWKLTCKSFTEIRFIAIVIELYETTKTAFAGITNANWEYVLRLIEEKLYE